MTRVAFDLETHLFGPGRWAPKPICVSYFDGERSGLLLAGDAVAWLREQLRRAAAGEITLTNQTIAYDMGCLLQRFPDELGDLIWDAYDAGRVQCVYAREKLLDIAQGISRGGWSEDESGAHSRKEYRLAAMVQRRFGVTLDKETYRTDYDKLDGVPLDDWSDGEKAYAIDDSIWAWRVDKAQGEEAARLCYDFEQEAARQAAYAFALHLTKCRGVMVDQSRAAYLESTFLPLASELRDIMGRGGIVKPNGGNDQKAIRSRVITSLGANAPRTDPTPRFPEGQIKSDIDTVALCNDPVLRAMTLHGQITTKVMSTYVNKLREAGEYPLHAEYDGLGAKTGRSSSSDPNMQNQPRALMQLIKDVAAILGRELPPLLYDIRECIKARDGFVFIACDFDAQEMRTWAQVCQTVLGSSLLAERFRQDPDFDPHTYFASQRLGITYDEALRLKKAKDPLVKDRRQRAKAGNFGRPGGMGAKRFQDYARGYGVDLSFEEAQEVIDGFDTTWPETAPYFTFAKTVTSTGRVEHLFSGRWRATDRFTATANSYFQGLAGDASKTALLEVTRRCYDRRLCSPLFGCRPVIFVHDEIMVEAPEAYANEAAHELERIMCAAQEVWTPDVPARATPALMRYWSKAAGDAVIVDGRYIPYEDR